MLQSRRWRGLLARARGSGRFLGVDERSYPRDFATFARYHAALPEVPDPLDPEPVGWSELEDFMLRHQARFAVQWLPGAAAGVSDDPPLGSDQAAELRAGLP